MIRYALSCERGHGFESWFPSSESYDRQTKKRLLTCPVCQSAKVDKAIMAPSISRRNPTPVETLSVPESAPENPAPVPVAMLSEAERELRQKIKELRDHLTRNSQDVGAEFPEQARKIHYGETEHRSIHGQASPEEAKALLEEGVELQPLPFLHDDWN